MRNIFLKNHTQNVLKELVPDPFMMKSKLCIPLGQQSEMLCNLFLLHVQVELCQSVGKPRCWSRKIFLMLYFINWPNFIVWLRLLLEILVNISIVIIQCPVCDVGNFEINHSFFIKSLFYITKTSGQKYKYMKNEKCL